MKLPDLSYMMTVAGLRYIQSIYEPPERRKSGWNGSRPAHAVAARELRLARRVFPSALCVHNRFNYYVLSRTRYYDDVYRSAVADGITQIVNIGAGSDTRAYRFADELKKSGVGCWNAINRRRPG